MHKLVLKGRQLETAKKIVNTDYYISENHLLLLYYICFKMSTF